MAQFRKARKIIDRQVKDERFLHYPYRVALSYVNFYERFENKISQNDREEIGRAAKYIQKNIENLPGKIQRRKYINKCYSEIMPMVESIFKEV